MRAPLLQLPPAPVVLLLLILGSVHHVAGSEGNDPYSGKGEPFSGDHSADGLEVTSGSKTSPVSEMPLDGELSSGINYDYAEEYDFESQISSYIIDDLVRVEQVIKPTENKTESENTTGKPKRKKKGGKKRNRKKNPCRSQFKNFCIHGECVYREDLKTVTCKCHPDYSGERCGEKSMKTHSMVDGDLSKITLAAIATFVLVVCLTVIAVAVTTHLRKRNFRKYEGEAEEQKKLRQDNGNAHAIV